MSQRKNDPPSEGELRRKVRLLPHQPGVYLFKDRLGRIIYVGKARSLHRRVHQYFHPSRAMKADRKTRALIESIRDLEHHTVNSDAESVLLEGKLIKEFRPKYNVSFRDDKRFLLVRVNLADPFPRFSLTRVRKDDGARYFGPFPHSGSLRSALNAMKKKYGLRSCTPRLPGESDFKHCLDHVIKNCSAPCIGRVTRAEYLARVRQGCEFLEGKSGEMLGDLESQMKAAAEKLDFEKAAQLRNLIDDLKVTSKPIKRFRHAFHRSLNPSADVEELRGALGLEQPLERIECFDIANISTTHIVASMVSFKNGRADSANYRRYRIKGVAGQDDFASMAEVVRRRYQRVVNEGIRRPDLIVIDGGKGQLGAAKRELDALGMRRQAVIGLAKKNEEIFRPGQKDPLVLDHRTGALRLLQRVRDEAHRFANSYHSLLLKRRLSESVLDDCPGVSAKRKKDLLAHFRSITRLRKATAEEIAAVPGIGPKSAAAIERYLATLKDKAPQIEVAEPAPEEQNGQVVYELKSA
ncbi:MAG: excinuclease ABC subunit UvrC [Verrucomicrobiota bacterium]